MSRLLLLYTYIACLRRNRIRSTWDTRDDMYIWCIHIRDRLISNLLNLALLRVACLKIVNIFLKYDLQCARNSIRLAPRSLFLRRASEYRLELYTYSRAPTCVSRLRNRVISVRAGDI